MVYIAYFSCAIILFMRDYKSFRSTFFHYGLGLEGNAASILDTNSKGEVKVKGNSVLNINKHSLTHSLLNHIFGEVKNIFIILILYL